MSETLVTELLRFCKTRCGIDLNGCSGPRDLLAAEFGMLKCLVAAGRAAMQRWCEQVGDGYVGALATRGAVRYRFVGRRQKAIHGLFGVITLVRAYYAPLGGGGKGWVPLAEQLGIGGGYTPGCQYFMARLCAEQSYEQGLAQFDEVFRPDGREKVSMNKAFEMVRAVTDGLEEQRRREIVERADEPVEVREEITGTMVVSIDAGKVPVRANERLTEDGKKSYDRVFRDSKVATVSAVKVDREGAAHCTKTSCVTGIEHADRFFPRIEVEMSRRSTHLGSAGAGDSGRWSALDMGPGVRFGRTRAEGLAHPGFLACLRPLGDDQQGVVRRGQRAVQHFLRALAQPAAQGCVAAVIKELQELHASGCYTKQQCYHLQGEINYFTANQQRMLYPLYRSCGLPIGSGVVESACKNVVAKRMKQSGMSWSLDGAKEMLQLRASVTSRRFWDDYERLLPSSPTPESDQTHLEAA